MKNIYLVLFLVLVSTSQVSAEKPYLKNDSIANWELVFADEFDGDAVNWNIWNDEHLPGLKHGAYSQPQNAKVEEGELRLYLRKESVQGSTWTSASIFLKEPIKPYSYVECKVKPTQCTGVNNAFWMANRSEQTTTWKNRVEIDMLETRYDTTKNMGNAHLGWHDWKAQPYLRNKKGALSHVAQGKIIYHEFDTYDVWGIYFMENDYIIYHNGEPIWNGKTHHLYPQQYYTGVGPFDDWFEKEGKRAYGKFGQDDWNYQAGYSGDNLNVILTMYTWPEKWSPITDDAADTYMAVDYLKIYRPKSVLNKTPKEHYSEVKKAVLLKNKYSLAEDGNHYFSAVVEKKANEPLEVAFADEKGQPVFSVGADVQKQLFIKFKDRVSSTANSYPANLTPKSYIEENKKYLMVVRVTAHEGQDKFDRDGVSLSLFPLAEFPVNSEPYYYPNIDSVGNTSINAQWQINAKNYSNSVVSMALIKGNVELSDFKTGDNYISVLPADWQGPTATMSGSLIVKPNANASPKVKLTGKAPWSIAYTVNGVEKRAENILEPEFVINEIVAQNTDIVITEVKDVNGDKGYVAGSSSIVVMDNKTQKLQPIFDTFIQPKQTEDFSTRLGLEIKGDHLYERQAYMSFDVSKIPEGKKCFLSLFVDKNQKKLPMVLSLQYVDVAIGSSLRYENKPMDEKCIEISKINIDGDEKFFVGAEITGEVAYLKQLGARTMNLRLIYYDGEKTNMVSFQQGHAQVGSNPVQILITDK